jgi:hypothetical protein
VAAFIVSCLVAIAGLVATYRYSKRRPVGATLTWGEAIVAATFGFALMFWCYGVVPHQWLTYASNDLVWRSDKILIGWHLPFSGQEGILQYLLPFTMNYENIAHIVVVAIYGIFLGLHGAAWSMWQNRAKPKAEVVPTSGYGRPLVKQG